ncbi:MULTISPECIES: diaminobutyrate--2-oxoglutarate transaminase [Paenibacillus]|jgi:diaminobutyrate-2-oxoglutarate transaminase|uniref:diaminobutyrate--2-oxoglutarate transaminase n=1 Tax=Paenibacillus TaxID=44249 RepID=UPI000D321DEB|nr:MULTISPECIES: diaminobutyrate--2-oxoglutarate transaminase [Paenibacillus]KAF6614871.1 diaminobutyrate--2-oxoglutarate transaminase [Paenibacillus sp. EKM101P]KAF6618066.1 diaminobutyrate--2-oxoglutarate transaminase [Paenibacillus sp. EKM102P]KAF6626257.1 diaminobutyrate--2-oxoglutarate transaminase [Paenibacillus sp. EKM10P]KAF6642713.1 diaminobutyrate--2-oxoglutarate transaminase [Paenibacillus sp. EKM11P]MBY0025110.1 diaminobutyrate--2-oxoglutarate transaminase [Paenibacillus polymyxa]
MNTFETLESNVRSYCRSFPVVFNKAKNDVMYTEAGEGYIDFFAGAGALNYGHNNDFMKNRLLDYLTSDRIMHGLDMYTTAKQEFIESFSERILRPKGLNYKLQFCGPTGTNAVEAALKLARKVKKRNGVFAFMGAFHGMSLGSLSITSNNSMRESAGVPLNNVTFIPYNSTFNGMDTILYMEQLLTDTHSGVEKPAAIILETIQAEGGINIADNEWLRDLRQLCDDHDILLIVDDIQVGCGRVGSFFSFERAGIVPDMVVLSKSISGYGLPMSLLLLKPELDIWSPGEHNGTFRGNQLAFVGAKAALEFRDTVGLEAQVKEKEAFVQQFLREHIQTMDPLIEIRGLGLIWGIDVTHLGEAFAKEVATLCFSKGLIIERAGRNDTVLKIMPALTISMENLSKGCNIIKESMAQVTSNLVTL